MLTNVIGDLFPSAVGVALSPVPIIAVILILGTPKARTAGLSFAAGWVVGLVVVSAVVLILAGSDDGSSGEPERWSSILKLVIGVGFFALAAKQWQSRPQPGESASLPPWMASIDGFTAAKCFGLGALLSGLNPKNLALIVASSSAIAQAGLEAQQRAIAVAVFVVVGSISVLGPVVFVVVAPTRAAAPLSSIKSFMTANVATIMMVTLVGLGAKMFGAGLAGLAN